MSSQADCLARVRTLPGTVAYDLATLSGVLEGFRQSVGTPLVEAALLVALHAHARQVDKSGVPYILHPVRVMLYSPPDETHQAAALLHDVVEDTPITLDDLREWGFPEDVLRAVDHLTQQKGDETHADYVSRCALDPIACAVKYADLKDNMDPIRQRGLGSSAARLMERYRKALTILDQSGHPQRP